MTTALQHALGTSRTRKKKGATSLKNAVQRVASAARQAPETAQKMAQTGVHVLHAAETQGALFLASLGEGYLGTDRLRLGGVDVRAPAALLTQGYGLYQAMHGKEGASHALALGNGLMGSWLASLAVQAGQTLARRAASTSDVVDATTLQGLLEGPVREVLLTPEPDPEGLSVIPSGRFVRARGSTPDEGGAA